MQADTTYPPIGDYALISDGRSMALVSRAASIDWCCMPRADSGSCFGRLLDHARGGFCSIGPTADEASVSRSYLPETMVLTTTYAQPGGEGRVTDCFTTSEDGQRPSRLLRLVEGVRGQVEFKVRISPRFDYGEVRPWLRFQGRRLYSAIGGNDGLLIWCDAELQAVSLHDLEASFRVEAQQRVRLSIEYRHPGELRSGGPSEPAGEDLDRELEETIRFWEQWARGVRLRGPYGPGVTRSALALKALADPGTGAIAAAATTSLPEAPHGSRNWDYRFTWVRDSSFSLRSLAEVGCFREADDFRRFIEDSAAGAAEDLQIMYGLGGERRLPEIELQLEGYRGARPVRVGNAASRQQQLDVYGELLDSAWRLHERGHSPDDDYWRFLVSLVDAAVDKWQETDRGLWESRGKPQHYVESKAMLWAAVDKGIRLAEECLRQAPIDRWKRAREAIRKAIESKGYDAERKTFVQAFGRKNLDASLLLLPMVGFIDYKDSKMLGTVAAIQHDLDRDGLILRYRPEESEDGLQGEEGSFIACTFWLAECLAHQGRLEEAQQAFDRALATSNDLGLFSEEFDTESGEMLGNFPQALTHLSHISAAVALSRLRSAGSSGDQ